MEALALIKNSEAEPLPPEVRALIEAARAMLNAAPNSIKDQATAAAQLYKALAPFAESSTPALTEEQQRVRNYVDRGGVKCPCCTSSHIEGGPIQTDAGIAWQEVICTECQSEWNDEYTLTWINSLVIRNESLSSPSEG